MSVNKSIMIIWIDTLYLEPRFYTTWHICAIHEAIFEIAGDNSCNPSSTKPRNNHESHCQRKRSQVGLAMRYCGILWDLVILPNNIYIYSSVVWGTLSIGPLLTANNNSFAVYSYLICILSIDLSYIRTCNSMILHIHVARLWQI